MKELKNILEKWQAWHGNHFNRLDEFLPVFKTLFAYNSCKIENDEVTLDAVKSVFERGELCNFTGSVTTVLELQNQKECMELLLKCLEKNEPISTKLIKDIHFTLTKGTYDEGRLINDEEPGQFKKQDYFIGVENVGTAAPFVEEEMEELVNETNNSSDVDVLVRAAYFHACFENIRPFADGNGRTGRMLLNYFLLINNYPPVIIFDENKDEYYYALNSFDIDDVLSPMKNFIKRQMLKTWSGQNLDDGMA